MHLTAEIPCLPVWVARCCKRGAEPPRPTGVSYRRPLSVEVSSSQKALLVAIRTGVVALRCMDEFHDTVIAAELGRNHWASDGVLIEKEGRSHRRSVCASRTWTATASAYCVRTCILASTTVLFIPLHAGDEHGPNHPYYCTILHMLLVV
eukprot:COSAG02_NODE_5795_length_4031_cov_7.115209_5_plen_150_part_00